MSYSCPKWPLAGVLALVAACADDSHAPALTDAGSPAAAQATDGAADAGLPQATLLDAATSDHPSAPPLDAGAVEDKAASGIDAGAGAAPLPCVDAVGLPLLREAPATLAGTALYRSGTSDPRDFAPYAQLFQPQYELWSDGAAKQRFVYLPACTQVDTREMDYWRFPVGVRFWKEFRKDGTLLETRFIHRYGPGDEDWLFATYQWDPANPIPERALKVVDGAQNVNGTAHDIPSPRDCRTCHINLPEPPLAFSAIQLSHTLPGLTLRGLSEAGLLTKPATHDYKPPGDETARAALGYLHANCGHCHNSYYRTLGNSLPNEPAPRMRLSVDDWSVEETTTYETLVAVGTFNPSYRDYARIEPCNPQVSSVLLRMAIRSDEQMPPLATETVHEEGVELVRRFLTQVPTPGLDACPGAASAAAP